ncbi:MAG: hypothetical protein KC619_28530 [Myxococcales bacterium]|nr:hypothetical protein [Myxococcales bacterium]
MERCELCREDAPVALRFGLGLCDRCSVGDFGPRQDRVAGVRMQRASWRQSASQAGYGRCLEISAHVPFQLPFTLSLRREGFVQRVGKLFVREPSVGDPRFDEAVYIRSDDPDAAEALLASEGLREVVLHVLSEQEARMETPRIEIAGRLRLKADSPDRMEDEGALRLAVAALARHVASYAERVGLPLDPARQRLPDLDGFAGANSLDDVELAACVIDDLEGLGREPLCLQRLLKRLTLRDVTLAPGAIAGLAALARLESFVDLRLERLAGPVDLSVLVHLPALRTLSLRGTTVLDLAPVAALPSLERLLVEESALDPGQLAALERARPGLAIAR